jgi:hypothetical protein
MSAATIALLVQAFQAAVLEAPQVIKLAKQFKDFITALLQSGAITVEQANAIHTHVDAICSALDAGTVPPGWEVRPDPA